MLSLSITQLVSFTSMLVDAAKLHFLSASTSLNIAFASLDANKLQTNKSTLPPSIVAPPKASKTRRTSDLSAHPGQLIYTFDGYVLCYCPFKTLTQGITPFSFFPNLTTFENTRRFKNRSKIEAAAKIP
jgi:hypothetical protein